MSAVAHYQQAFASLSPSLAGAGTAWMDDLRAQALRELDSTGFPGSRDEDWKYTSTRWLKQAFAPSVAGQDPGDSIYVPRLETLSLIHI